MTFCVSVSRVGRLFACGCRWFAGDLGGYCKLWYAALGARGSVLLSVLSPAAAQHCVVIVTAPPATWMSPASLFVAVAVAQQQSCHPTVVLFWVSAVAVPLLCPRCLYVHSACVAAQLISSTTPPRTPYALICVRASQAVSPPLYLYNLPAAVLAASPLLLCTYLTCMHGLSALPSIAPSTTTTSTTLVVALFASTQEAFSGLAAICQGLIGLDWALSYRGIGSKRPEVFLGGWLRVRWCALVCAAAVECRASWLHAALPGEGGRVWQGRSGSMRVCLCGVVFVAW